MILPDELVIEMTLEVNDNIIEFEVEEGIGTGTLPPYEGEYIVTPRKVEQVLETNDKRMTDDVTVEAISYIEVGNLGGGTTATIGFE